jgi:DNA helicase-2/ATP-dependent DNA helicase PcrA
LVSLLANKNKNIFVVGDFDQSIYMFRGADLRNILNFEKEYPDAKIVVLEENYRSTQNILTAAAQVIKKNKDRIDKNLWTKNPAGPPIIISEVENEKAEGWFIIKEIQKLLQKHKYNLSDFAVLYRTNAQSRAIEEAFLQAATPYKVIGSVKFYDRREIKDLLAYLKLIQNPKDVVSLERIINIPPRGIGKASFSHVQAVIEATQEAKLPAGSLASKKDQIIQTFFRMISDFRKQSESISVANLIKLIIDKIDYKSYILKDKDGEARWENIEELFSVTKKYDSLPKEALKTFLEEASLLQNSDEVETEKSLVNLMTLHCAKGLEFPVIFIIGCEEGIFPHSKSLIDREQMEEERRLCYVGITRAKELLYFLFTQRRLLYGNIAANPPSRFLSDFPEELVETRQPERKYKYFNDEGWNNKEYKYF